MSISMRPGVYTEYTVTPVFSQSAGKSIGIVAVSDSVPEGIQTVTSLSQASRVFGAVSETNLMMQLIQCVYSITTPIIYAVAISEDTEENYRQGLDLLRTSGAYLILCGKKSLECYEYVKTMLSDGLEKIAVLGILPDMEAKTLANQLNCERICLTCPQVTETSGQTDLAPAILAAFISQSSNASSNLNGSSVSGNYMISEQFDNETVEQMLTSGVCVFEQDSGVPELIRGMTTRTLDDEGNEDYTYRNLSVIRVLDTVIPSLRDALKGILDSSRGDQTGLNSILSLTVCKLDNFLDEGLIASYEMPVVSLDETDKSVCIVEVAFVISQGISSIYLTAHISV
jgi:hypothetical protein